MMLSAPAGYGKTVLLGQWAEQNAAAGILTAWATLTPDDRDPLVLWTTIVDALSAAAEPADAPLACSWLIDCSCAARPCAAGGGGAACACS